MWEWLKRFTYGWLWIDPEAERRKEQAYYDSLHPQAVRELIRQHQLNQMIRDMAARKTISYSVNEHAFDQRNGICSDCGIHIYEFHAQKKGIPCDGNRFRMVPFAHAQRIANTLQRPR